MLWSYARGIDIREVQPTQERKSTGVEVNWGVWFLVPEDPISSLWEPYAAIDHSDAAGMTLMDLHHRTWSPDALHATALGLEDKLGPLALPHSIAGKLHPYYVNRYNFNPSCQIVQWSGDNPCSLAGLAMTHPGDIAISLGTGDTVWMGMCFPTLLIPLVMWPCWFTRTDRSPEKVQNRYASGSWDAFNELLDKTPPLNEGKMGFFYKEWESLPPLPGASLEELAEAESVLKCRFPPAARLLYRLCNGQSIPQAKLDVEDEYQEAAQYPESLVMCLTNCILPPLTQNRCHGIIAASSNLNKVILDCEDGNVYVGTRNLLVDGEMMVCVPEQASGSEEEAQDGMLRWLEHYAHCLQLGMFHVRTEEGSRSISMYPETEPYCTTAVTRSVQVQCSGAFVPELSRVEELDDSYWFCYPMRMHLLNPAPGQNDALNTCQLSSRHWVTRANDIVVVEIRGRAVIGMYPLLRKGDEEFVYESYTKKGSLLSWRFHILS